MNNKTNSIILTGTFASGKTFLAETIASLFESEKVLRLDTCGKTVVGMAREINQRPFDLIIFDECADKNHIKHINKYLIHNILEKHNASVKTVIYLTQDSSFKSLKNFKVIQCCYKSN